MIRDIVTEYGLPIAVSVSLGLGSMAISNSTKVFVGDNNVVDSGVKYTGHIRSNTSELDDITASINTFGKYEGKMQFNQSTNKPCMQQEAQREMYG